jgi:anti-sigma B factor antagonist
VTAADTRPDLDGPRLRWSVTHASPDHATVAFAGRFDAVEALAARTRLAQDDVVGRAHLVLDLHAVTFLDSAGLAVLVRARRDRQRDGRTIALVRPASEDAMRVLRLTQFDQIFTLVDRCPPGGP